MTDITQGSDEWKALRVGKVTASRIADLTATTKTGPAASRANYMAEIVAEILTGQPAESGFTNAAMAWGTTTEPEARAAYSFFRDTDVAEISFVVHPTIARSGCSPDGLIDEGGLLELKCPNTATHIATLLGGSVPGKYIKQMQWQMACTGRQWCDFASYDPRLPDAMRLFVARVDRDNGMIAELEVSVNAFIAEAEETVAKLQAKYSNFIAEKDETFALLQAKYGGK